MTTVKFDKSVKYQGVRYAAHESFEVADEDVAQLKEAGATVLSTDTVVPPIQAENLDSQDAECEESEEQVVDTTSLKESLLEYTVADLVKFAEEHNIDLQKKTKKAEIYNIIVASLN